jgi:chemotaxis protein histidine kinase CheA
MTQAVERSDPTWHVIVEVPERFKLEAKAAKKGARSHAAMIAQAEAALQDLSANFDTWIDQSLEALERAYGEVKTHGLTDETAQTLFRASHNIKGLAGTVGFPLAGQVADSLCGLIDRVEDRSRVPMILIDQHVASITAIIHERARETGTAIARTLVERLVAVTNEFAEAEVARAEAAKIAAQDHAAVA